MPPSLIDQLSARHLTFVVGKGGVGKSTTAAAIALSYADRGHSTLLVSTDPAPSITDIFGIHAQRGNVAGNPCSPLLVLEELDAERIAADWMERARAPLEQLIEQGTYLSHSEIQQFTHLTLPGVDELAAAIRITQLAESQMRVVVDTAPTGHTLRVLDSAVLIDSWVTAFRAMADKSAAVSLQMAGARVRLPGEDVIDELSGIAAAFRAALNGAAFVVVTRGDPVVHAETTRLMRALRARAHSIDAIVTVREPVRADGLSGGFGSDSSRGYGAGASPESGAGANPESGAAGIWEVPMLSDPRGCEGLRAWAAALQPSPDRHAHLPGTPVRSAKGEPINGRPDGSAVAWLRSTRQRLLWFGGKGGVGKSTCAAAAAISLAADRRVVLCSTDPAGSLAEVLGGDVAAALEGRDGGLRVVQVNAAADLAAWRDRNRHATESVLGALGIAGTPTLDRAVIDAAWDVTPPGVDELFALSELLDATQTDETVVVDAAPTGHFLRLLASPAIALDWTHALMRVILSYGVAGQLDGFSERMLAFAKQLKHLSAVLTDPARCGVFVVSLPEPVVEAQTERLVASLRAAHIAVAARIVNHADCACPPVVGTLICAPTVQPAPCGVRQLEEFIGKWRLVHE